jgi:hypothetical protein
VPIILGKTAQTLAQPLLTLRFMRVAAIAFAFVLGACSGGADESPGDGTAKLPGISDEPEECPPDTPPEFCTTESGATGARVCTAGEQSFVWSDCLPASCMPYESQACFPPGSPFAGLSTSCQLRNGAWSFDSSSCNTPLVLAFDDEPVTFTNPTGSFDLAGRDTLVQTDWVRSDTPWLVLDHNANGVIDDGAELFGSMTRLAGGARAKNGFLALAPLDTDGDGWITSHDPAFAKLGLWRDTNQDRVSSADEIRPAAESVVALSLSYRDVPRCSDGNCERERAELVYRDRDGNERRASVVDVYLSDR